MNPIIPQCLVSAPDITLIRPCCPGPSPCHGTVHTTSVSRLTNTDYTRLCTTPKGRSPQPATASDPSSFLLSLHQNLFSDSIWFQRVEPVGSVTLVADICTKTVTVKDRDKRESVTPQWPLLPGLAHFYLQCQRPAMTNWDRSLSINSLQLPAANCYPAGLVVYGCVTL